jgi:hypothetical protein
VMAEDGRYKRVYPKKGNPGTPKKASRTPKATQRSPQKEKNIGQEITGNYRNGSPKKSPSSVIFFNFRSTFGQPGASKKDARDPQEGQQDAKSDPKGAPKRRKTSARKLQKITEMAP